MNLVEFLKSLPPDLTSFLTFIATPTVLGPVLSELLEYLPQFQKLVPATKTLVLYVLMILIGLFSYFLVHWVPASALENAQPIYAIIIAASVFFASSQLFHNKVHGTTTVTVTAKQVTSDNTGTSATTSVETKTSGVPAGNTVLSGDPLKPSEVGLG